ncbi:ABC transporter C family member 1 [Dorcoceras hygrometricum]|uniref:ABC transporter C family member 1 n=1 Tax=Dorcoceras hygrometricum TaxID=472368 RepID=A0A2Z7APV8_9LAMI|nr:ABC transporter C family member 1 [Dorcoceras hygrometricum]
MSLFNLQDVRIAIGSLATLDLPMVVDLIWIYVLKGPYCTLTTTNWFLQALSVIPRGSWGDVASFGDNKIRLVATGKSGDEFYRRTSLVDGLIFSRWSIWKISADGRIQQISRWFVFSRGRFTAFAQIWKDAKFVLTLCVLPLGGAGFTAYELAEIQKEILLPLKKLMTVEIEDYK